MPRCQRLQKTPPVHHQKGHITKDASGVFAWLEAEALNWTGVLDQGALPVVIDEGDELLFVPPGKWTLGAKEAVEDISLGPQFLLQIVCPRHCLQVHPCRPGNLIAHGIPPV